MISTAQAKRYCYEPLENIENYDKAVADNENLWDCHHRVEMIMNCGARELIGVGAYYDRPAHELIFLTQGEHRSLHKKGKRYRLGKKLGKKRHYSEETRRKMSEVKKGNKNHLGKLHSEETKRKISEARKSYWENRRKQR